MMDTPTNPTSTQVETSTLVKMFTQVKREIESLAQEVRNYMDGHVDNMSIEDLRVSIKRNENVLGSFTGDRMIFP